MTVRILEQHRPLGYRGRRRRAKSMRIRSLLYTTTKVMGDVNAVKKGKVGRRIARRAAGKVTGRLMGRLFG